MACSNASPQNGPDPHLGQGHINTTPAFLAHSGCILPRCPRPRFVPHDEHVIGTALQPLPKKLFWSTRPREWCSIRHTNGEILVASRYDAMPLATPRHHVCPNKRPNNVPFGALFIHPRWIFGHALPTQHSRQSVVAHVALASAKLFLRILRDCQAPDPIQGQERPASIPRRREQG